MVAPIEPMEIGAGTGHADDGGPGKRDAKDSKKTMMAKTARAMNKLRRCASNWLVLMKGIVM